jgi:hypothetical protein
MHTRQQHGSIESSFARFERLSRPQALAIGADHGLSPTGSLDDIKNAVIGHIAEGSCGRSNLNATFPSTCAKFRP